MYSIEEYRSGTMTDTKLIDTIVAGFREVAGMFTEKIIDPRSHEDQVNAFIVNQIRCDLTYPESERTPIEHLIRVADEVVRQINQ